MTTKTIYRIQKRKWAGALETPWEDMFTWEHLGNAISSLDTVRKTYKDHEVRVLKEITTVEDITHSDEIPQ